MTTEYSPGSSVPIAPDAPASGKTMPPPASPSGTGPSETWEISDDGSVTQKSTKTKRANIN